MKILIYGSLLLSWGLLYLDPVFAADSALPPAATNGPGIDPKAPINASGVDSAPSTNNLPAPQAPGTNH